MSHLMLFSERPPIYASSFMTISGERTEQLDIFCCVTGFTSDFIRRKRLQIYASGMTISGERTEQHVVIGFGELAAVNYNTDTDTGLLVCSQKAKIQNKHKTQVKYSAK